MRDAVPGGDPNLPAPAVDHRRQLSGRRHRAVSFAARTEHGASLHRRGLRPSGGRFGRSERLSRGLPTDEARSPQPSRSARASEPPTGAAPSIVHGDPAPWSPSPPMVVNNTDTTTS